MRLLTYDTNGNLELTKDFVGDDKIPAYAILSHTWQEGQEVTFDELMNNTGKNKPGYEKIRFCGEQAGRDGLRHFWVDTCCIDKANHIILQDAINSMFYWYQNATKCYVFLSDVGVAKRKTRSERSKFSWLPAFRESRWFTRGWTLQELLAPRSVEFFSREGKLLGDKRTLEQQIHEVTGIDIPALQGALHKFDEETRFSWTRNRQTTRKEDKAYSLLGIFGIYMLPNYGEGEENAFKRLRKEIKESQSTRITMLDEEQKRDLLISLHFGQIGAHHMSIKNAHEKTCKWLLSHSEYLNWVDSNKLDEHHGFLWIKGKPGTGKSTLMKYASARAREEMPGSTVITFFFNARGVDVEKSATGAYRSLLLQLLVRLPALQTVFDSLGLLTMRSYKGYQWSAESLKTLLERAIQKLGETALVCFIDALDECDEWQIRDMIQFFDRVSEYAVSKGISFRICFASRHYPHITIKKGLNLILEGQKGHTQDIVNYLEAELKIGKSKIAQQVRGELEEKASGVFMWVVLAVNILNKEHDRGRMHALKQRLKEIPSELHELFHDILMRGSRNGQEAMLCIEWVLFAKQPLSPEQLYFAVLSGAEPDAVSEWDYTEITKNVIRQFILDSSKGLTEITKSTPQRVQFIHESVRDFLLKENGLDRIWPDFRGNIQGHSHERLKQCCLTYINADVTPLEIPEGLRKIPPKQAAELLKKAAKMFPFLEYAVKNVLYHANAAQESGVAQDKFLLNFPPNRWVKLNNLFQAECGSRYTEKVQLQYVLGQRNMSSLIRACPSQAGCLEVGEERYGPPLFAAMATKSDESVQVFFEVLHRQKSAGSRLNGIYIQYCENVKNGMCLETEFEFSKQRGVLSHLAELGNESVFGLVFETGEFEADSEDRNGRTPLSWAAGRGNEKILKLLLETGKVEVDFKDRYGRTPLSWASKNGHEAAVKMLLETGKVDVDSKDMDGRTPLSWAVANGSREVVKVLLESGNIDCNPKDKSGWTPLWWALWKNSKTMIKVLLEASKVDINSEDVDGRTPLLWASRNGHKEIVKMLLETGKVDVNSTDNDYGRTALFWAVTIGHESVVRVLLESGGVDSTLKDKYGQTPLLWALENGRDELVKMLRKTGKIDVDSKD